MTLLNGAVKAVVRAYPITCVYIVLVVTAVLAIQLLQIAGVL